MSCQTSNLPGPGIAPCTFDLSFPPPQIWGICHSFGTSHLPHPVNPLKILMIQKDIEIEIHSLLSKDMDYILSAEAVCSKICS